ncbi:hypothetical protein [Peribacillus sp. TH14]|uniref:hypothetical protein n=1 Tax=Peribacillus sp. TH14 TaxID=2798481 RepID=UPI001913EB79|nr:hypothetical protein [Peribacillus sp. TH14]MBK5501926.1 hypothetical protein [Peribacillus sp. TH14]
MSLDASMPGLQNVSIQYRIAGLFLCILYNNKWILCYELREKYNQEIYKYLNDLIKDENRILAVTQLSMVEATEQFEHLTTKTIINPLNV